MRKTLITILAAAIAIPAMAQLKTPRVSQHASVTQTIGLTDVTISYSRPGVKNRKIWGALVPYGQVWRTGANEATTIAFSDDVTVEGKPLAKGTYMLATIPNATEWTVIFNSVANQWGAYSYDATKDVLRVNVKPQTAPFTEWMTFDFPLLSADSGTIQMRWADLALPITVNAGTTAKVMANAKAALATAKPDDWRTPYQAASFALDNGFTTEASAWLDQSLKAGENMTNLWLKARLLAKRGEKADAIRTGELALSKKTEKDSAELAAEIRKQVDEWKK